MRFFDRLTFSEIHENQLPEIIDLGRFYLSDSKLELTYSSFNTDKFIKQEIFLKENEYLQKLFEKFHDDIEKGRCNGFNSIPLIQRITEPFKLNQFEKLLIDNIFHIEEIFREPYFHLDRKEEKLHVSKVKRIPLKSYEYLSYHTEDWLQKSVVSFRPNKILTEEYELFFDIYENRLAVALVDRIYMYLRSRTKQIQDLKDFHNKYMKLLDGNYSNGWYQKLQRNFKLMGSAYEDEHYNKEKGESDKRKLIETEEQLEKLYKRVLLLKSTFLYRIIDKRSINNLKFIDTDLLINHKHYKYIRLLWHHLEKYKPDNSVVDRVQQEQMVINGIRSYAKFIITYLLKNYFNYNIKGSYTEFIAEHSLFDKIVFTEKPQKYFEITIGQKVIIFVVFASEPEYSNELIEILTTNNIYILYYSKKIFQEHFRLIPINPLDPDSVERVGIIIRSYLYLSYIKKLKQGYKFKSILRDYIEKCINLDWVLFDLNNYTYRIQYKPKEVPNNEVIIQKLYNDSNFKKQSKSFQKSILDEMVKFIDEIKNTYNKFSIFCFNCGDEISKNLLDSLDYIICPHCNVVFDSSKTNNIVLKFINKNDRNLSKEHFGMDYLDVDINCL